MKLILNSSGNIYNLMRQCGYSFKRKDKEELVFSRIISQSKSGYPRFHIYVRVEKGKTIINLHFDQKRPIYKGVPAHSAEYNGEIVENELRRIRQIIARSLGR